MVSQRHLLLQIKHPNHTSHNTARLPKKAASLFFALCRLLKAQRKIHGELKQRLSGKLLGIDCALLPNREWNQKQKPKKQPWSKVECFAFGGATVRFASLETSFHAANHTVPPPPSYEGLPLCPKDKNHSQFHGEKTPDKNNIMVRDVILHVRS